MHDDGARASGPTFEPPAAVVRQARWLRLALAGHAALAAALWLRSHTSLHAVWAIPLVSLLSMGMSVALALLWMQWVNTCCGHLVTLGRKPSAGSLGLLWVFSQMVPFVGWLLLARVLHGLAADTDPRQLPPVTEEREQEGGFRQSSVVRVELGSVARPLFPLWAAVTGASLVILGLAWNHLTTSLLATTRSLAMITGALLAIHLVGAVSHNLGELERRLRRG